MRLSPRIPPLLPGHRTGQTLHQRPTHRPQRGLLRRPREIGIHVVLRGIHTTYQRNEFLNEPWIELPAGLADKMPERLFDSPSGAPRPVVNQGVESVTKSDYPRGQRNRVSGNPVRVSFA